MEDKQVTLVEPLAVPRSESNDDDEAQSPPHSGANTPSRHAKPALKKDPIQSDKEKKQVYPGRRRRRPQSQRDTTKAGNKQ